ncbi:MAG: DNA internalization-related competence protein ComEC/Rec2, partial [Candidatus Atribacteria bacterium]|nr:DNA internalization-related competence protein ComEC/Rec2 [Candidatus Atribacteria bacterium]
NNSYQEVILDTQLFQGQKESYHISGKVLLRIYGEGLSLQYGDMVKAKVLLQEPKLTGNFGEFDYREYLARQKIFLTDSINIEQLKVIGVNKKFSISSFLYNIKESITKKIEIIYHYPHSELIKAIITGDKTEVPQKWELLFQDAGVMHILAISGLHVGIIASTLFFILKFIPIIGQKNNLRYLTIIIFLMGYAAMTGFRPSVSRATLMFLTLLLATYFNRPYHIYNSLYLSALLILFYQPLFLYDAGFLLSFTVTFFIIYLFPILEGKLTILPYYISKPLAVSLAAWFGMAPLSAYFFYKISYIAILSNLIIVPLLSIILIMGLISIILSFVFLPLAGVLALLNQFLISLLVGTTNFLTSLPFAYQFVGKSGITLTLYYYFIIMLFFYGLHCWSQLNLITKKRIFWTITSSGFIVLFMQIISPLNSLSVHFLNVGYGDSILIKTPQEKHILIDGGGTPFHDFDVGENIVLPYLRRLGINHIDLIFLTHPDIDHLEGLIPILKEMKVDMVIDSGINCQQDTYLNFLSLIQEDEEISYYQARAGDVIKLSPDLQLVVLNPLNRKDYGQESNFNNRSIVLKLYYKNISFLFTGDIEEKAEMNLLSWDSFLQSDILKVAHHGSNTSTTDLFLNQVKPEVAIISVGTNNFDHPNAEVIRKLEASCQKVLRTDLNGTVLIRSNGQKYYITTLR